MTWFKLLLWVSIGGLLVFGWCTGIVGELMYQIMLRLSGKRSGKGTVVRKEVAIPLITAEDGSLLLALDIQVGKHTSTVYHLSQNQCSSLSVGTEIEVEYGFILYFTDELYIKALSLEPIESTATA